MDKTLLVGLSGKSRSGKDRAAWFLIDLLRPMGVDARRYAFADALKAVCRVEHGMVGKDARLLQRVGTDYRDGWRKGNNMSKMLKHPSPTPNIWLNATLDAIREEAPRVALCPDVRFPNEHAAMHLTVRIERPTRPDSGRDDSHISETALDDAAYDFTIVNDGDLPQLRQRLRETVLPAIWERL